MNFLKKLASDTMWYGLSSILSRIIMFVILTPYLSRILANGEYGIHGIMYAFAALLMTFFTFRLETAFFRFGTKYNLNASLWTSSIYIAGLSILLTIIIVLNNGSIASVLTQSSDARFVTYFAFILLLDSMAAIPFAYLRLESRPRTFAFIKILNIVVTVIVLLFFLEGLDSMGSGFGNWVRGASGSELLGDFLVYDPALKLDYIFVANLIASLVTYACLLPIYIRRKPEFDFGLLKEMLWYSAPLVIVGIAATVNQLTDRFFVKELLPGNFEERIAETGVYVACARIAVLMNLFTQAYNYAAEPFFFKSAEEEENPQQIYARSAEAFFFVGFIGFLLISLNLFWIKFLIDFSYWGGLYIVPVLLMAYLVLGLYYNLSIWYKVTDKTKYGALVSVVGAVFTIGLNFLLVPMLGLLGAALTTLCVYGVMCILTYWIGRKYYPIPYKLKRFFLPLTLGLFVYFYFHIAGESAYELSLQVVLVNIGIAAATVFILYFSERRLADSLIDKVKARFSN